MDWSAGGVARLPCPSRTPILMVERPMMNSRLAGIGRDFSATVLAMASHDLRQPLQVIVGAHDLLARIPQGGAARAQLMRAEDATRQLTDILDLLVEALRLHEFPTRDQ